MCDNSGCGSCLCNYFKGFLTNQLLVLPHMHAGLSVSQLLEDLADVPDWYGMGVALGLKSSQLNAIEIEVPPSVGAVVRRKSMVLDIWMKGRADPPIWIDVVTALHQMKEDRTADRMREKYSGSVATAGLCQE